MIGAIIGGAAALGGSLWNAIAGSREARRQQQELDRQERENQMWYERRYNEPGHERADAQRLLTKMQDAQAARSAAAAGRATVVGSSGAMRAAQQRADNQAIADTTAQINAANEARRDRIDQQHHANRQAVRAARINASAARQNATAQAATGAMAAGAYIAAAGLGNSNTAKAAKTQTTNPLQQPENAMKGEVWYDEFGNPHTK